VAAELQLELQLPEKSQNPIGGTMNGHAHRSRPIQKMIQAESKSMHNADAQDCRRLHSKLPKKTDMLEE
jgi:hypothetical protein